MPECPALCGVPVRDTGRWRPYDICPGCGTGYREGTSLQAFWSDGGGTPSEAEMEFWGSRDRQWRLALPARPGRVLDVGCSLGHFVQWAEQQGHQAVGVEPSSWARSHSVAPGQVFAGLDEVDGEFDAITMWDVLEHIETPAETLRDLHARLRPGGTLLVSSPDFLAIQLRWPMLRRNPAAFNDWVRPNDHCTQFTGRGLRRLLARTGFAGIVTHHPPLQRLKAPWGTIAAYVPGTRHGLFITATRP